jgi:type IV secretion system protein VirB4
MVPLVVVTGIVILLAMYTTKYALLLLPPLWVLMNLMARRDAHIFNLALLKLKTKGNAACNNYYGATAFLASDYDAIDITELNNSMKLNERVTLTGYIPYSSHIADYVIKTKNNDLISTWEIGGSQFECSSDTTCEILTSQINNLIKSFEGQPVTFYVHNIRESFKDSFQVKSGNQFADRISELYYASIDKHPFRCNRLFFTVCYMPFVGLDKVESRRMPDGAKQLALDGALKEMDEICQTLNVALSRFCPVRLGLYEENGRVYSSQVAFYQRLLTGRWRKVAVSRQPFWQTLGTADLFFSTDAGQSRDIDGDLFFRGLEIKDYSPETLTGVLDALLYAPCDYTMTHSFTCMAKGESQKYIRQTLKRLKSAGDDALSQREDLLVALDMLQAGAISFGKYHFSLMVVSGDTESLIKDANVVSNAFTDLGITPTLATLSLAAGYLAQMPGVYGFRPRLAPVSSENFAELASFHNFYPGKRSHNPWGDAITILKTPSGSAHYLNLHNSMLGKDDFNEKNPGNTGIIGTTGSGKTMTMTFIQQMVQKYGQSETFSPQAKVKRQTTVYFDKDRGAEMNIRSLGGKYFRVKYGEDTGWNPFRLEPTRRNVNNVKKLMTILCTRGGQTLTPRDEKRLSAGVDAVMLGLPFEDRSFGITRLLENLPEPPTKEAQENGLRIRLQKWAQGGEYGWVFDNDADTFEIDCDNFGIDGTEFLDDEAICAPISFYLLYRVTSLLDGRRLIMFMDEFWKWLLDRAFSDFAYNMLKVIRKLNGVFIAATQSPDEILKSPIAAAVIEQCSTKIFLPNPNADYKDYVEGLKVSPEVFGIVKSLDPLSRQFVIVKSPLRRGDTENFTALATLDLSGLGSNLKIMSGSSDNLEIFDDIWRDGMTPDEWVDRYLSMAI